MSRSRSRSRSSNDFSKTEIAVIMTCFNRKNKTLKCINTLVSRNKNIIFYFIIVDDASMDGTVEAIRELPYNISVIMGSGDLYWCGGMRIGIDYYFKTYPDMLCLLVNDDVNFFDNAIEKMCNQMSDVNNTVIVGATQNSQGKCTYGLRKYNSIIKHNFDLIKPNSDNIQGDTMNGNCVLIPAEVLKSVGNIDPVYSQQMGDFDLGIRISKNGYSLVSSCEYVGICEKNSIKDTWMDTNLSRKQRFKLKESPKGPPFKEWFHFARKNFGINTAIIHSITPYIKILIGK